MKTKIYIAISLLYIVCCANVCNPGKSPEGPTYYITQEFKDYVVFKKNSYWIYSIENSLLKDTIILFKQGVEVVDGGQNFPYSAEIVDQQLRSRFFKDTILGGGGAGRVKYDNTCIYSEVYRSSFFTPNYIFFSDKEVGYIFAPYGQQAELKWKYTNYYDSYEIEGKTYQAVKVFEGFFSQDARLPRKTYYAKNIGVIRKELWNGQVWNPVEYSVSQ
jgi:hypothetical protein